MYYKGSVSEPRGFLPRRLPKRGINFMSLVCFPKSSTALPSWVPDLTALNGVDTLAERTQTLEVPFHASREKAHAVTGQEQEAAGVRVFPCRGVIIDRITRVSRPWEADADVTRNPYRITANPFLDLSDFAAASAATVISDASSRHPFRADPQRLAEAEWRVPILGREAAGYEQYKYLSAWVLLDKAKNLLADIPVTGEEATALQGLA